jgi:hypothetical protein
MSGELHNQLVSLAAKWLAKSHSVVITEIAGGSECPDAIGWTSGSSTLIECKASRSDFKADASKQFRAYPSGGMGVFRYYLAPADLIKADELPDAWGLLEVNESGKVRSKMAAKPQKANRSREVAILVSSLRRLAEHTPPDVKVRFYSILSGEKATFGIEPTPNPPRPNVDRVNCSCKRAEGETGGHGDMGHDWECKVVLTLQAAEEWDKKYKEGETNVLSE